jgi:ribosome-binding factor A
MKKTRRTSRVGEMVRDALVEVFRHDLKEIDVGLISVNEVEVSPDLHYARVYITGFHEDETRAIIDRLQELRGKVRHSLGKRIHLRYTPELDFRFDETAMRASRIEALLMEVLPPKPPEESEDGEPDPEEPADV